jgi:hypothetical protein
MYQMFSRGMYIRTVFCFVGQSEYKACVSQFSNQLRCFETTLRGGEGGRGAEVVLGRESDSDGDGGREREWG